CFATRASAYRTPRRSSAPPRRRSSSGPFERMKRSAPRSTSLVPSWKRHRFQKRKTRSGRDPTRSGEARMVDPDPADAVADIPDPAERVAGRTAPRPPVPSTPALTRAEWWRRAALSGALSLLWVGLGVWLWHPRSDIGAASAIVPIALWS